MADLSSLCFTNLLGQDKAKGMLTRSLAADRIPHAYIFKGPAGVGRRLFGRGVAAAVNCRDRQAATACGVCTSCKKIHSGNHPDFQVISPEKSGIKINQIRTLCRDLTYPPYESEMRVVVLEDVHTMRQEAANSLLKTLEEPPENNLLILTAESSQEILATLTSRCQVVPFSRLRDDETATILEEHGIDPGYAQLLALLSEGSPGRALQLKDTDIVPLWQDVVAVLSVKTVDPESDLGVVLKLAAKMAGLKDHLDQLLNLLRIWLRELLVVDYCLPPVGKTVSQLLRKESRELKNWSSGQLFAKLQAIEAAEKALARNCNRLLVCEVLLFKLQ